MSFQLVKIRKDSGHHLNEPQFQLNDRPLQLIRLDGGNATVRTVIKTINYLKTIPVSELEEFTPPRLPDTLRKSVFLEMVGELEASTRNEIERANSKGADRDVEGELQEYMHDMFPFYEAMRWSV